MVIRFTLFLLLVSGFALFAYAIVSRTRSLETRQIEKTLLSLEKQRGPWLPAERSAAMAARVAVRVAEFVPGERMKQGD